MRVLGTNRTLKQKREPDLMFLDINTSIQRGMHTLTTTVLQVQVVQKGLGVGGQKCPWLMPGFNWFIRLYAVGP